MALREHVAFRNLAWHFPPCGEVGRGVGPGLCRSHDGRSARKWHAPYRRRGSGPGRSLAWVVALLIFFPILWTILTAFKTEGDAILFPPAFFPPHWTLENFFEVQSRSDYFKHFFNSVVISVGSTLLGLHRRRAGRLVDGVLADQAHQGHPDVDAVDQDDAGGRRAGADLPHLQEPRPARQSRSASRSS